MELEDISTQSNLDIQNKNPDNENEIVVQEQSDLNNENNISSSPLPEFDEVIQNAPVLEAGAAMFSEYCEYSSVHGVRYLGERRRTWREKLFWIGIFAVSIYICTLLISDLWAKWNNTPVIVNFAEKATPVWKVPFPTLTICPDIKSTRDKFSFASHIKNFSKDESIFYKWTKIDKTLLDVSLQICDYSKSNDFENMTKKLFYGSFLHGLEYMTPNRSDIFIQNKFYQEQIDPTNSTPYFDRIITEMGLCYGFNLLDPRIIYRNDVALDELVPLNNHKRTTTWTLENGYLDDTDENSYPYRTFSAFSEHGLTVRIRGKIDDIDSICGEGDEGFKIAISTPGDIPQLSRQFVSIPFNHEVLIDVSPDLTTISDTAADYSPEIRQCYFGQEKYLKYFKVYTQPNCEFECLTNYTLQKCECVRFNMPRLHGTPVCGAKSISCYLEAKKELLESEFIKNKPNITMRKNKVPDCNCLPTCTSLFYKVGVKQAPLHSSVHNDSYKVTKIQMYYKDDEIWSSVRSKLYDTIQFTANAGGLLGLFMGISVVSFVEICYYLTIRFIGHLTLRYCSKKFHSKK